MEISPRRVSTFAYRNTFFDGRTPKFTPGLGCPRRRSQTAELVAPVENWALADTSLLQESVIVTDFGQSYAIASLPKDYQLSMPIHYLAQESRFEGRTGLEADVWNLRCAIFEIRAGFPLFEPLLGSYVDILRQTVETFGRLPDPWWSSFKERTLWFEEDGEPRSTQAQELSSVPLRSSKSSIQAKLRYICTRDEPPSVDEGHMIEKPGSTLDEEEIDLLEDLLTKMLKYNPEERLPMREVIQHPWFTL